MKLLVSLIAFIFSLPVLATTYLENKKIDELFLKEKVQGTIVVFNLRKSLYVVHNPTRMETRFVPASTFKIPNSLIGLSVGAVKNVDDILPYGGKPQPFKSWEKNMGLRDAIKISNVPIYKELARRIGLAKMEYNIHKINYGNNKIGNSVDSFWLEGPMKISAFEQIQFLSHLAQKKLPFRKEVQDSVIEIIKLDKGRDWTLYGKTGWANHIGWWVGWVAKQNNLFCFALNMDMKNTEDAQRRIFLGKATLKILGILD